MSSEEMSRNFKRWTFRSIRIIDAKTDAYKYGIGSFGRACLEQWRPLKRRKIFKEEKDIEDTRRSLFGTQIAMAL
jgi:hypothetical protein